MSADDSYDEDAHYRKIASRYSVSTMSNAKWLRLFRAVIAANVVIEKAEWRFLANDHPSSLPFPQEKDLRPTRFADGPFQPVAYRWIESVFAPREYAPRPGIGLRRRQDIAGLRAAIEAAGLFELEEDRNGLTLVAYRP